MNDQNSAGTRFSVAKTFGDAVAIFTARWRAMFGATILMGVAIIVIYGLFAWPLLEAMFADPMTYDQTVAPSTFGMAMLGGLIAALLGLWLLVAIIKIALEKDHPHGVIATLTAALPRVPSAIGIYLLIVVAMIAIGIVLAIAMGILAVIGVMFGETMAMLLLGLGYLIFLFVLIYVMLGWVAALPAMIAEKTGAIASMARSWRLAQGNRWRLTALWVLSYIVVILISMLIMLVTVPGLLATMGGDLSAMQQEPSTVAMVAFLILNVIVAVGVQMFFASLYAATYHNLAAASDSAALAAAEPPATG